MNKVLDSMLNHFVDLKDIEPETLKGIIEFAKKSKADALASLSKDKKALEGKQIALIFEKPSTRTRVSFESAINKLGGNAIVLESSVSQIGRGETISDTSRVLSRYVDLIMIRCFQHNTILEMAENSSVPVINGLTDYSHPCQVMADIMTYEETMGSIEGKKVVWVGDCNNMANTWIQAVEKFDFELVIACPEELSPPDSPSGNITVLRDPKEAAKDADLIMTDTWVSMGDEDADKKVELLQPYQVDDEIMGLAKENAVFMHCLPAHRGHEVSTSVMDGPQSLVWDEAENRLHVQKAIMLWSLGKLEGSELIADRPFLGSKVLVVEDNNSDASLANKILEGLGCEVKIAHDGQEACDIIENDPYDVIFMDCLMPVMNGFDATTKIRELEKDRDKITPIIAITTETAKADQTRAAQVGMNDFIAKPLGPRRIKSLMKKWYKKEAQE